MKKRLKLFIATAFLIVALLCSSSVFASQIISGISANEINIDSNFNGQQILLFGAKRDTGDILIVVRGPQKKFFVTKKEKFLGIWYNGQRLQFNNMPIFYSSFATNSDLFSSPDYEKLFNDLELGKQRLKFRVINEVNEQQRNEFYMQLIENLEKNKLYQKQAGEVNYLDETLFKVILNFPKNIARGTYSVDIYLIEDGALTSFQSLPIYVYQIGLSAKILDFAYQESFIYGLLAVLIALICGWLVNYIFNKFFSK